MAKILEENIIGVTALKIINESYSSKLQIKISIFGVDGNIEYSGIVKGINLSKGEIQFDNVRMLFTQIAGVKYSDKIAKRML